MRKIAVVTGTRAEYGYLKPLMKTIVEEKNLQLVPIISGMHLLSDFGNTYKIVEKDFSKSIKIPMQLKGDSLKDMAYYLSSGVKNFTGYFSKNPPDIVVVLGDRSESLAAAISCMYLNIPVAHINGGDVSGGTIDESIRHMITKIAHIHLAHTKENADRIEKMGENSKRIYVVGALTLDTILNIKFLSKQKIFKKYNLDYNKKTFLVIQHPITTIEDRGYSQLKEILIAIDSLKEQTILVYPNCDAGGKKMINLIKSYSKRKDLHIFKNIPYEDYLNLMKEADILIGNSSSGIIESPSFKKPVINIGERQKGRTKSDNIIDVAPNSDIILNSINYALTDKDFIERLKRCENKFGDGNSSERIVKILKSLQIDSSFIHKQLTY